MVDIRKQLPPESHEAWDEMVNFDPTKFFTAEKNFSVAEWKGHKMQPTFPAETTRFAYEEWSPREGDVFVIAFPKAGLNWTNEIVTQLLYFDDANLRNMVTNLPLPMALLETGSPKKFKVFDGLPLKRRKQCSHLPGTLINVEKIKKVNAKVVYVLRNPKDQAVSWYKFLPKLPHLQAGPLKNLFSTDWNSFLQNFTEGKMPIGMRDNEWYPDHILSWLQHMDDKNVMFFYYEDMKKDLLKEISRMAKFLEVDLPEDSIRIIARNCEFANMKKTTDEGKTYSDKMRSQIGVLRKGVVGGWKEQFTVAQSESMDKIIEEKLGNTDIHFTYEL